MQTKNEGAALRDFKISNVCPKSDLHCKQFKKWLLTLRFVQTRYCRITGDKSQIFQIVFICLLFFRFWSWTNKIQQMRPKMIGTYCLFNKHLLKKKKKKIKIHNKTKQNKTKKYCNVLWRFSQSYWLMKFFSYIIFSGEVEGSWHRFSNNDCNER